MANVSKLCKISCNFFLEHPVVVAATGRMRSHCSSVLASSTRKISSENPTLSSSSAGVTRMDREFVFVYCFYLIRIRTCDDGQVKYTCDDGQVKYKQ